MSATYRAAKYLIDLGPVIILPALLFMIGLFTTRNIFKNLRNCLFIFLGMTGIALLITMFVNFFEPLSNTILINSLKEYEIIDAGWTLTEIVFLNSSLLLYIILGVFSLNLIMLLLRLTRTINIDLWGYWNFLLAGAIIYAITEVQWIAVLISIIVAAITFSLADIYASHIESYYGIRGISNTQSHIICWAPISHLVNAVMNKIPFIKKLHLFYCEIHYKLGFLSEPMIFGFLAGFIIGLITRYRTITLNLGTDILYALSSGLRLSFIMILLPRAVNLLMMGLVPAIDNLRSLIRRRITRRTIYIGIDSIVLVGHPSVIVLSVIIIPLTIFISTLLPGNRVLPSADLVIIPFLVVWAVTISRGDLIRSFISAVLIIPLVLWITTDMSQFFTSYLIKYEFELVEGYSGVSSMGASSNIFFWVLLQIIIFPPC